MIWLMVLTAAVVNLPKPQPIPTPPGELLAEIVTSPPYGDWYRFPPKEVVSVARRTNYAFRTNMDKEREEWPASVQWRFDLAIRYAEWSYRAYDLLDDALQDWRPWWERRIRMKKLRELIGEDDYAAGLMPPPLPVWMFRELR